MNILIIPEDFLKDQYILKPLFERLVRDLGRPATVRVCQDPRLGGIDQALKLSRLTEILEQYRGMVQLFILCVDRDGNRGRRQRLDQIERELNNGQNFLAENAWEELETWLLAGLRLPSNWRWADIRAEVEVKERYFDVLAQERGVADTLGGGRKRLGEQASRRIRSIRQKCREDFDNLAQRIEATL